METKEEVIGYIFTHWDCPMCDEENTEEGEVKQELVYCWNCLNVFSISDLR